MFVVFFTMMVMVVMELVKLREERPTIIECRELVYTKEGIAGVKPAPYKNTVSKSSTLGANAGDREALVDRGKQVVITAGEAITTIETVNTVFTAHHC